MPNLDLDIAFWDYDRTRPLMDGRVRPEGINPKISALRLLEVFPCKGNHISPDRDHFLEFAKTNPTWHFVQHFHTVVGGNSNEWQARFKSIQPLVRLVWVQKALRP